MTDSGGVARAVRRAMAHWFRHRRRWTDEVGYKSPQEIALENAAESLGVTLGEYYADDLDPRLSDLEEGADARVDSAREELLAYAEGLRAKRKRRLRAWWLRVAGGVAALVLVVAAIVMWTPISDSGDDKRVVAKDPRRGPGGRSAESVLNAQSPLGTSVSSELRDGRTTIINLTYLNPYGDMCSAVIERRGGISERNSSGGCLPPARVAADLRREPAFVTSILVLVRRTVIRGYARTDVKRIAGRSPSGDLRAAVTPVWTPDGSDRVRPRPLKAFLVVAWRKRGGRRITGDPLRGALDDRKYNLVAELRGGRVVPVGSPMSLGRERGDRLFDPIAMTSTEQRRRPQDANHRSE